MDDPLAEGPPRQRRFTPDSSTAQRASQHQPHASHQSRSVHRVVTFDRGFAAPFVVRVSKECLPARLFVFFPVAIERARLPALWRRYGSRLPSTRPYSNEAPRRAAISSQIDAADRRVCSAATRINKTAASNACPV